DPAFRTVEVRGFEPLSAYRSLAASTCVFCCSSLARSAASRRPIAGQSWRSRRRRHDAADGQPELDDARWPASGELTNGQVQQSAELITQPERSYRSQLQMFP